LVDTKGEAECLSFFYAPVQRAGARSKYFAISLIVIL
jgi:hypothetical protein